MSLLAWHLAALLQPFAAAPAEAIDPRFFIGTWSCIGQVTPAGTTTPHAAVGLWRVDSRRGGALLVESFQTHTDHGASVHAWGWVHFDGAGGGARRTRVHRWPGLVLSTTEGWRDGVLIWEGESHTAAWHGRQARRETVTRESSDRLALVDAVIEADGSARPTLEVACTRLLWAQGPADAEIPPDDDAAPEDGAAESPAAAPEADSAAEPASAPAGAPAPHPAASP